MDNKKIARKLMRIAQEIKALSGADNLIKNIDDYIDFFENNKLAQDNHHIIVMLKNLKSGIDDDFSQISDTEAFVKHLKFIANDIEKFTQQNIKALKKINSEFQKAINNTIK